MDITTYIKDYSLIFLTAALVGTTIYYAIQTKRNVDAIKESTAVQKESTFIPFTPFVNGSIVFLGPTDIVIIVINIGKGTARKLEIEIRLNENSSILKQWYQSLLTPDDFIKFPIPISENANNFGINYFSKKQTTINLYTKYEDIFYKVYINNELIDVTSYVNQLDKTLSLYLEKPLDHISRKIDEISKNISSINNQFSKINNNIDDLFKK